jgi:hypothetical protein
MSGVFISVDEANYDSACAVVLGHMPIHCTFLILYVLEGLFSL